MLERGKKEKERKRGGRRRREAKNHWGSPLRKRGGLDQAQWPSKKFENLKINWFPHLDAAICVVGEGNSPTKKGGIMVSCHCPPYPTKGNEDICAPPI